MTPDGRHLVHAVLQRNVAEIIDVVSGQGTRVAGNGFFLDLSSVTWSPDGTRLEMFDGIGLFVVGADGSGSAVVLLPNSGNRAVWSPAGAAIAIQGDTNLMTVHPDGPPVVVKSEIRGAWSFTWAPDGHWIAVESNLEPGSVAVDLYQPDALTRTPFARAGR